MIAIRPYQDSDYPEVIQNHKDADMYDEVWDSRENLLSMINFDIDSVKVAVEDNKVVGSVIIMRHGDKVGIIYRLIVAKSHRSKGIGSLLIAEALKILKNRGTVEVGLYENSNDLELKKYYLNKGFQTTGNSFIYMFKPIN